MFYVFCVLYTILLVVFFVKLYMSKNSDPIFAPWPGFVVFFCTYLLIGTISLPGEVTDVQWLVYCLGMGGFIVGCLYLSLPLKQKVANSTGMFPKDVDKIDYYYETFNPILAVAYYLISMAATVYLWISVGIPFFSSNVNAARVAYLDNGYIATVATMLDVTASACFAYILSIKGRRKTSFYYFCILVCSSFLVVALFAGSRTRLLKFLVPCLLIYNYYGKKISIKTIFFSGVMAIIFIGFIGYFRNAAQYGEDLANGIGGDSANWNIFQYILYFSSKELSTAAYGLDLVINNIPSKFDFTYGTLHLGAILAPFKLGFPNPGDFFKEVVGGHWDGFGLASTFFAPMYSDFSVYGVFLCSVFYGAIITKVYNKQYTSRKSSVYWVSTYALLFFFMVSGVRSDMVSFEVFWFVILSYSFCFFRKKYKISNN